MTKPTQIKTIQTLRDIFNMVTRIYENAVIQALVVELGMIGWKLKQTYVGGEMHSTTRITEVVKLFDDYDDVMELFFTKTGIDEKRWIKLVPGNGPDIISDYIVGDAFWQAAIDKTQKRAELPKITVEI